MELSMDILVKRFKDYVSFDTQSDEDNDQACPSTPGQMVLAKHLAEELKEIGLSEVELDNHGYVMATLPANGMEDAPVVGFIAHVDTSPSASGKDIKPQIVKNYDGKDIVLNAEKNIIFSTKAFPEVLKYQGQDIMFTDGTTLLGADDKAGVTAIVSAAEYLSQHPEIKHGKIRLAFTPDEEVGGLAHTLDLQRFGAPVAYTLDGDHLGWYEDQTFNASEAVLTATGLSVHTGTAKGIMVNASDICAEFLSCIPQADRPQYTEGTEGFFHVLGVNSTCEKGEVRVLIRDFDAASFRRREELLKKAAEGLNERYAGRAELRIIPQYRNMGEVLGKYPHLTERLRRAITDCGIEPVCEPFRGGTDGSSLSWRGLPCPNLSAGYENAHGRFEYVPIQSMEKNVGILLKLVKG